MDNLLQIQQAPVAHTLPQAWAAQEEPLDNRIYALVILGRLIQGLAIPATLGCAVCIWAVSPIFFLGLIVPLMLFALGLELTGARVWPDGSIYFGNLTTSPFIANQPVGMPKLGNNCCINSALQLAFTSPAVHQVLDLLPEVDALVDARDGYRLAQHERRQLAYQVNTQRVRESIASFAYDPLARDPRARQRISPSFVRQEDAAEVLGYILEKLVRVAQTEGAPVPAFVNELVHRTAGRPDPNIHIAGQPNPITRTQETSTRLSWNLNGFLNLQALPAGMSEEQAFIQYVMQPNYHSQNPYGPHDIQFLRPPQELFIQYDRFAGHFDAAARRFNAEKITREIPTPFRFTLPANLVENPDGQPLTYEVDSFIVHHGSAPNRGHYTAYVKSIGPNGVSIWWRINDSRVYPISNLEAQKALRSSYNFHCHRV
jgi:hypothetical protein